MNYETDFKEDYLYTEYGKIYYKFHENKNTNNNLILIHGFAASIRTWKKFLECFSDSFNVYLIDLLGHGSSDAPKIEYSVNVHCNILKEFISQKKLSNVSIFGHSYGAWIVAFYASENSNLNSIILEDAAGLEGCIIDKEKENKNYKEKLLKDSLLLNTKEYVLKNSIENDYSNFLLNKNILSKINTKTLIIWGRDDDLLDFKYSYLFKEYIKNRKLEIINNSKHTPHYSNPKEVYKILEEFISE